MDDSSMTDIISIILSFITLIFTIYIPKKISWEQFYNSLMTEYRSIGFGRAMQNVIHFYTETCGSDVNRIKEEYEKERVGEECPVIEGGVVDRCKNAVGRECNRFHLQGCYSRQIPSVIYQPL